MQSIFGGANGADPIGQALEDAERAQAAGPWRAITTLEIGGLTAIGFERAHDMLLVTSTGGQSVIDGTTGEILYRNRDADGLDIAALKGTRLDHPADERFDMAGLYGGGLRRVTDDGWSAEQIATPHGTACVLHPAQASIRFLDPKWKGRDKDPSFHLIDKTRDDIRAFGFSWTGRTLALAAASALTLWGRPAPLTL